MLVDCDDCAIRGAACRGCLVTAVLGAPPDGAWLDPAEWRALRVLTDAGLAPHVLHVADVSGRHAAA